jgi:protein-disulfide isomerase
MKRYLPLIIIVVVLIVAVGGSFAFFRSKQHGTSSPFSGNATPVASAVQSSATPLSTPSPVPKPTNLPAGVSITVEEVGDYQCPPCGRLYPELKAIGQDYGNHIKFVFRNLPLSTMHKNALLAAQAAESARLQNRFEQMHDRLYETQDEWKDLPNPRPTFIRFAGELGLDTDRFDRDMDGIVVQQRLAEDQQRADAQNIKGTPTVLVDGREMKPELTNGEGIRKGINYMLQTKAGTNSK